MEYVPLRDFVSKSLVDILQGVSDAQKQIGNATPGQGWINPGFPDSIDVNGATQSRLLTFYSILGMTIEKSPGKTITFTSVLIH